MSKKSYPFHMADYYIKMYKTSLANRMFFYDLQYSMALELGCGSKSRYFSKIEFWSWIRFFWRSESGSTPPELATMPWFFPIIYQVYGQRTKGKNIKSKLDHIRGKICFFFLEVGYRSTTMLWRQGMPLKSSNENKYNMLLIKWLLTEF